MRTESKIENIILSDGDLKTRTESKIENIGLIAQG